MNFLMSSDVLDRVGRALADPNRQRILMALLDGPRYPGELATQLGVTRSNMSNHLGCLRGCGLVVAVPEGRKIRYEFADERLADGLRTLLGAVLAVDQGCADDLDDARSIA